MDTLEYARKLVLLRHDEDDGWAVWLWKGLDSCIESPYERAEHDAKIFNYVRLGQSFGDDRHAAEKCWGEVAGQFAWVVDQALSMGVRGSLVPMHKPIIDSIARKLGRICRNCTFFAPDLDSEERGECLACEAPEALTPIRLYERRPAASGQSASLIRSERKDVLMRLVVPASHRCPQFQEKSDGDD